MAKYITDLISFQFFFWTLFCAECGSLSMIYIGNLLPQQIGNIYIYYNNLILKTGFPLWIALLSVFITRIPMVEICFNSVIYARANTSLQYKINSFWPFYLLYLIIQTHILFLMHHILQEKVLLIYRKYLHCRQIANKKTRSCTLNLFSFHSKTSKIESYYLSTVSVFRMYF